MSALSTPRGGRRLIDKAANIAVVVVLLVAGVGLISGLASLGESAGESSALDATLTVAAMVAVLVSYLVLVLRGPSTPRWIYLLVLTIIVLFGLGASLGGGGESKGGNVVGLLVVSAFIGLPAVYMRLRTPKAKVKR